MFFLRFVVVLWGPKFFFLYRLYQVLPLFKGGRSFG
jgi:hypothetical protein